MGDFSNVKMDAEKWLRENDSKFQLISDDPKENRLIFGNTEAHISFNIICPSESDGSTWSVCSEQEDNLAWLQDIMEFVDSQHNLSITRILDRVARCLTKHIASVSSQNGKETGGSEETLDDAEDDGDDDGDDYDDEDTYYDGDDLDACDDCGAEAQEFEEKEKEDKLSKEFFEASGGTAQASTIRRLYSDMKAMAKTGEKYGFTAGPEGNNLFKWNVKLLDIPKESRLGRDLQKYAATYKEEPVIHMEMLFPSDYPFSPPFLRVLRPRFEFLTGHVTIGGSICMEMLTKSGWRPTNDIEGILVQVRSEILSDKEAALDRKNWGRPYTEQEAREAFTRMVTKYGWNH